MSVMVQVTKLELQRDLFLDLCRKRGFKVRQHGDVAYIQPTGWHMAWQLNSQGYLSYDTWHTTVHYQGLVDDMLQEYVVALITALAQQQGRQVTQEVGQNETLLLHVAL